MHGTKTCGWHWTKRGLIHGSHSDIMNICNPYSNSLDGVLINIRSGFVFCYFYFFLSKREFMMCPCCFGILEHVHSYIYNCIGLF